MCGIAGAFFKGPADPTTPVRRMCERMIKRGPDSYGEWHDAEAGLAFGQRRLAIIDLDSRSNQPLHSSDGRYVIVCNGEIYNYQILRAELVRDGAQFHTEGDIEVIVELYRRKGTAAFAMLRGMFALALWDTQTRKLVLARDPYGIKPLYVGTCGNGIVFASQVKGVLASGSISKAFDPAGIMGFQIWGSVPEPFTLYQDVKPVPAGSYMFADPSGCGDAVAYVDFGAAWRAPVTPGDIAQKVREALDDTVRAHLVSDVPVAVLLSGGVDSSVVAGLMTERGQQVEGFTIAFDEFSGLYEDEVPRARAIAERYGIRHSVRRVDHAEFARDLPAILDAMDQPSIDGVNTWFASKAVAEGGYKVVLSGVGGDELFCGYSTFQTVPDMYRFGRKLAGLRLPLGVTKPLFGLLAKLRGQPKLADVPALAPSLGGAYLLRRAVMTPGELEPIVRPSVWREGLQALARADSPASTDSPTPALIVEVAMLEATRYLRNQLLRDSDWASMAHSLELRTPLVDWKLLQGLAPYVSQFTGGAGKALQVQSLQGSLPEEGVRGRKSGFGLPMEKWLNQSRQTATDVPSVMRQPWARRWAFSIAEEFGFAGAEFLP